jgi:alpha-methylacyl-CoA racemase
MSGPLAGTMVLELAGLGPAPFCGMVLADLGAEVIVVDRPGGAVVPVGDGDHDVLHRGKRSIAVDLKTEAGVEVVLRLVDTADALIEGFRPGVVERLGLAPEVCLDRNPGLVYGRMTGWGQSGPMSAMAGHDIDYIALSGVLHSIGPRERPIPPLNLIGDFGGGGMLAAVGILSALLHVKSGGPGQVVDAAMIDGSALLMASHHGYLADGWWVGEREANLLDGGAPFYTTYETADGHHMAVGALEPKFFEALLAGLSLSPENVGPQHDREQWPRMRALFAERFRSATRDDWAERFDGTDACVAPVLAMTEAPEHPHNAARGTFVEMGGVRQPAPAPRFSVTPAEIDRPPPGRGADSDAILDRAGLSPEEIGKLRESGAIA